MVENINIQPTLSLKRKSLGPALTGSVRLRESLSYRESNEESKERQGPTLSIRLIEVFVKRGSTVHSECIGVERWRVDV